LLVEKTTSRIRDLESLGATVYFYGKRSAFVPRTRFTIINETQQNPSVLVGRPDGLAHVIERHEGGDSPVVGLASDLDNFIKSQAKPNTEQRPGPGQ
jgi:hypothetical protein